MYYGLNTIHRSRDDDFNYLRWNFRQLNAFSGDGTALVGDGTALVGDGTAFRSILEC